MERLRDSQRYYLGADRDVLQEMMAYYAKHDLMYSEKLPEIVVDDAQEDFLPKLVEISPQKWKTQTDIWGDKEVVAKGGNLSRCIITVSPTWAQKHLPDGTEWSTDGKLHSLRPVCLEFGARETLRSREKEARNDTMHLAKPLGFLANFATGMSGYMAGVKASTSIVNKISASEPEPPIAEEDFYASDDRPRSVLEEEAPAAKPSIPGSASRRVFLKILGIGVGGSVAFATSIVTTEAAGKMGIKAQEAYNEHIWRRAKAYALGQFFTELTTPETKPQIDDMFVRLSSAAESCGTEEDRERVEYMRQGYAEPQKEFDTSNPISRNEMLRRLWKINGSARGQ